eukprot:TRINITY_DN1010_c0_g2_i1.p1 TRINITY_DN1010_c0_g2~~TRINITY_DN1010_c0_g2_i1.p1  ORF type:complete len:161 (+),score=20.19 TRINITY_DN1010_c0_g2_i1:119-601(+)
MCIRDSINAEYGEPRFTSCLSAWMSVSPDRVAAPIPNNARADTGRREEVSDSRNTRMGDSIVSLEASLHSAEQSLKKEKTRREHMERLATTAVPHSPIDGPSAVKNARVSVGTMLAINQLGTQSRVRGAPDHEECEPAVEEHRCPKNKCKELEVGVRCER